jgi:cytochrome c5
MNTMMRTAAVVAALAASAAAAQASSHGKTVYERTCIACHGADGKGTIPGVPALGGKNGPLAKPDKVLIKSILEGVQSPGSPLAMPAKGGDPSLTEQDAAAVLQYMRKAFAQ